jgi:hypothetical protein
MMKLVKSDESLLGSLNVLMLAKAVADGLARRAEDDQREEGKVAAAAIPGSPFAIFRSGNEKDDAAGQQKQSPKSAAELLDAVRVDAN